LFLKVSVINLYIEKNNNLKNNTPTQAMSLTCINQAPAILEKDNVFITNFESQVKDTIEKYNLLQKDDKILVACSGGKDSTVILHILKKLNYTIEAITVDAHIGCYTKENVKNIQSVCKKRSIPLHIISFRKEFGASLCYIRDALKEKGTNLKSCTVCGVLRRTLLNKAARKQKATKLVLGHNQDDEAQAFLMNLLKNKLELSARMGPKTKKTENFVQRIKPLYFMKEKDIATYSKMHNFPVYYGKCPCSTEGYRNFIKDLLNNLEKDNSHIKENLIKTFIKNKAHLQNTFKLTTMPNACEQCNEPAAKELCRSCQILSQLKIESLVV
jgi:uncharacterized protein (TIGR00269 family)